MLGTVTHISEDDFASVECKSLSEKWKTEE